MDQHDRIANGGNNSVSSTRLRQAEPSKRWPVASTGVGSRTETLICPVQEFHCLVVHRKIMLTYRFSNIDFEI